MMEGTKRKPVRRPSMSSGGNKKNPLPGGNWKTSRKLRRKRKPLDLLQRLYSKKLSIRIAIVTMALFLLTGTLSVLLFIQMLRAEDQYHMEKIEADQMQLLLNTEKTEALATLADLRSERDVLKTQLNEALTELARLQQERDEMTDNDAEIARLTQEVADLQLQIEERDAQIEALTSDKQPSAEVNLQPVFGKLQAIQTLLESGAPKKTEQVKKTDSLGTIYYEEELVDANISVYAYDPDTGLSYVWEAGNTYDTGELKHLLLGLAILDCAAREQASIPEGTQAGKLTYDLTKEYELKSADIVAGSGILKNAEPGTKYTYLELIEIMLSYCDVTAYSRLSRAFPDAAEEYLPKIKGLSSKKITASMTAKDMMLVLRKAKEMMESDSPYAKNLTDALTSAVSTHYFQASGGTVARQYTLNANGYHELGIQLQDDQSCMVVVMTDLNTMTPELTSFLLSLYRAINEMMLAFE